MSARLFLFPVISFLLIAVSVVNADEGATIRGAVAQHPNKKFQIDPTTIPVKLRQVVHVPDPPYPKTWDELSPEARQAWLKKFEESEEGKEYIRVNEKKLDDAPVFDLKIESDGKFVVYDVPVGQYGLQGRLDKEISGLNHAFEVFGEVGVAEKVEEVLLEPLMLQVTPLFKSGDPSPEFKFSNFDDTGDWELKHFADKYVFIQFWSSEFSPPSAEYQTELQKVFVELKDKHPIDMLSICMDKDRAYAIKLIRDKELPGRHAFTGGWEHPSLEALGVRRIPSFWLIDPKGKIKMTHFEFNQAFASGKSNIASIISDRISGKDIPTLADPAAKGDDKANADK